MESIACSSDGQASATKMTEMMTTMILPLRKVIIRDNSSLATSTGCLGLALSELCATGPSLRMYIPETGLDGK